MSGPVAAHEADALGDLGNTVLPVVFIFDRDIAVEALPFQLVQDGGNVRRARAIGYIVGGQ